MKTIHVPDGIVHLSEVKGVCPNCQSLVEGVLEKFAAQDKDHIRHKCKSCKKFMGIQQNIKGDLVVYDLNAGSAVVFTHCTINSELFQYPARVAYFEAFKAYQPTHVEYEGKWITIEEFEETEEGKSYSCENYIAKISKA